MKSDQPLGRRGAVALAVLTAFAMANASAGGAAKLHESVSASTVEDQKAVMDAQIELMKKQAELRQAQRALAGTASLSLPTVVSVATFGERRVARLMTSAGHVSHFSEGDQVMPGVVVASVRPREVLVAIENGKRITTMPLQFSLTKAGPTDGRPGMAGQNSEVPPGLLPEPPVVPLPAGMPLPMRLPALPSTAKPPGAASTPAPSTATASPLPGVPALPSALPVGK